MFNFQFSEAQTIDLIKDRIEEWKANQTAAYLLDVNKYAADDLKLLHMAVLDELDDLFDGASIKIDQVDDSIINLATALFDDKIPASSLAWTPNFV